MSALYQKITRARRVNCDPALKEAGSGVAEGLVLRCGPSVFRCSEQAGTLGPRVAREGFLEEVG